MASTLRFLRTPIFQQSGSRCLQQPSSKRFLTNALKSKMELFQREDGTPVHLKGGLSDKLLFLSTSALSVIGVAYGMFSMLKMAFPKKA